MVGNREKISISLDTGSTWTTKHYNDTAYLELHSIAIEPFNNTCLAVGDSGQILFSSDSGKHWEERRSTSSQSLYGVSMDSGTALICGREGTVFHTTDQGKKWVNHSIKTTKHVFGCDAKTWTVVGQSGIIFRSFDSGKSWIPQVSNTLYDLLKIHYLSPLHGFIVGDVGTILETVDGGNHWYPQNSQTLEPLYDISFVDEKVGIVVGGRGTILTTRTGGKSNVNHSSSLFDKINLQTYPNPFVKSISIDFDLDKSITCRLSVLNLLGNQIARLFNGTLEQGPHSFEWNAKDATSGAYFLRIEVGEKSEMKMLLKE